MPNAQCPAPKSGRRPGGRRVMARARARAVSETKRHGRGDCAVMVMGMGMGYNREGGGRCDPIRGC
jgi:hypothetical protein